MPPDGNDEYSPGQELLTRISRLRKNHSVLPFKFANQLFLADGRYALYWPVKQTLIVSDLHLGKAHSLNRYGNVLPTFDVADTLTKLEALILEYQPIHVIALGDSFHDKYSGDALHENDRDKLKSLCGQPRLWTWVLGNHDLNIDRNFPGHYRDEYVEEGICFMHEPDLILGAPLDPESTTANKQTVTPHFQVFGHFHPKFSAALKAVKVTGRCFAINHNKLVMPSFGSYTGGLSVAHEVIQKVFEQSIDAVMLCHNNTIFKLPF